MTFYVFLKWCINQYSRVSLGFFKIQKHDFIRFELLHTCLEHLDMLGVDSSSRFPFRARTNRQTNTYLCWFQHTARFLSARNATACAGHVVRPIKVRKKTG